MNDSHVLEEKLEFSLGVDEFTSSLKTMTNQYHNTLKRLNTISADMGKGFTNLSRTVNSNISAMSTGMVDSTRKGVESIKGVVKSVQSDIGSLASGAMARLKGLENEIVKVNQAMRDAESKRLKIESSKNLSPAFKESAIAAITSKRDRIVGEAKQLENKFNEELSRVSVQTISSIAKSGSLAAVTISKTCESAIADIHRLSQSTGTLQGDVKKAFETKDEGNRLRQILQSTLKDTEDLNKQRLNAQKAFDNARIAMERATSLQSQEIARDNYVKSEKYLRLIENKIEQSQVKIRSLQEQFSKFSAERPQQLASLSGDITDQFLGSKGTAEARITTMRSLISNLVDSLSKLSSTGGVSTEQLIQQFVKYRNELGIDINQMKEMIGLMQQMGKAGHIQSLGKIQGMQESLTGIKEFEKELNNLFNLSSKLDMSGPLSKSAPLLQQQIELFQRLKGIYNESANTLDNLKVDTLENAKIGVQAFKEMERSHERMISNISRSEKELTKLEQMEAGYRRKAAEEENAQRASIYTAYADRISKVVSSKRTEIESINKQLVDQADLVRRVNQASATAGVFGKAGGPAEDQMAQIVERMRKKYEELIVTAKKWGQENLNQSRIIKDSILRDRDEFTALGEKIKETIRILRELGKIKGVDVSAQISKLEQLQNKFRNYSTEVTGYAIKSVNKVNNQFARNSQGFFSYVMGGFRNLRWQVAAVAYLIFRTIEGIKRYFISALKEIDEFRKATYALAATIGMSMGQSFQNSFDTIYNFSRDLMMKLQAQAAQTYASLEDMMMVTRSFAQAGIFPKTNDDVKRIATLATAVKVMTEGMANAGVQMRQEIMALIQGRQRVTDSVAMAFKMQGIDIKKQMEAWKKEGKSVLVGLSDMLESFNVVNKKISQEFGVQVNRLKEMWKYIKLIGLEDLTLKVAQGIKKFVDMLGVPGEKLTELGQNIAKTLKVVFELAYSLGRTIMNPLLDVFKVIVSIGDTLMNSFRSIFELFSSGKEELSNFGVTVKFIIELFAVLELTVRTVVGIVGVLAETLNIAFMSFVGLIRGLKGDFSGMENAVDAIGNSMKKIGDYVVDPFTTFGDRIKEANKVAKDLDKAFGNAKDALDGKARSLLDSVEGSKAALDVLAKMEEMQEKSKSKKDKRIEEVEALKNQAQAARERLTAEIKANEEELKRMVSNVDTQVVKMVNNTSKKSILFADDIVGAFDTASDGIKTTLTVTKNDVETSFVQVGSKFVSLAKGFKDEILGIVKVVRQEYSDLAMGMQITIEETKRNVAQQPGGMTGHKLTKEQQEQAKRVLELLVQTQNKKDQLEAISEENVKKTVDGYVDAASKAKKTLQELQNEYLDWLDRLGGLDPFTKLENQYKNYLRDIADAAKKNHVIAEHYDELQLAAKKWYANQKMELEQKIADNELDLRRQILGLELSDIQKVEERFDDLKRKIDKMAQSGEISKGKAKELSGLIPKAKQTELEKVKLNYTKKVSEAYTQLRDIEADYLSESIVFSDRQQAELIRLQAAYDNFATEIKKKIEEAKLAMAADSRTEEYYKPMIANWERQLKLFEIMTEKHKQEVMQPFFKDLKDMSDGWVDSISSSLTDILFEMKGWKQKVIDLFESISKQVMEAFIKRNLIQPLFDQMNGAGGNQNSIFGFQGIMGGRLNPLKIGTDLSQKIFGNGGLDQGSLSGISSTSPLPVTVTNIRSLMSQGALTEPINQMTDKVTANLNNGVRGVWDKLSTGFTGVFGHLKTGFSTVLSSLTTGLDTILSSLSGMFSGSSGGGGGMGILGSLFSMFGSSGGSGGKGFAEGGVLKEPVFGVGLKSGTSYSFAEKEDEMFMPKSKYGKNNGQVEPQTNIHLNVNLQAIDTQSGTQFLMKNSNVLEGMIGKALKNNKAIRRDIRNAY